WFSGRLQSRRHHPFDRCPRRWRRGVEPPLRLSRCVVSRRRRRRGGSRHGGGGWCGRGGALLQSLLRASVRILPLPALLLTKHADADGATEEQAMTTTHPSDLQLQFKQAVRDHWVLFLIQG